MHLRNTFPIIMKVTDAAGRKDYQNYVLRVCDPLQVAGTQMPDGLINMPYEESIPIEGGIGPYQYSYTGQLPDGLSLNTSTGRVSGTPTSAGQASIQVTVTDNTYPNVQSVTQSLSISMATGLTILTSAGLPNARTDQTMAPVSFEAGGGVPPYTWQKVSGNFPAGITLNPDMGTLSGVPLANGHFDFILEVTDANSSTAQKAFTLSVFEPLSITGDIPDGTRGEHYHLLLDAEGGLPPYYWQVKNGALPDGLILDIFSGSITGTPTTDQSFTFSIEAADSQVPSAFAEKYYSMEIFRGVQMNTSVFELLLDD